MYNGGGPGPGERGIVRGDSEGPAQEPNGLIPPSARTYKKQLRATLAKCEKFGTCTCTSASRSRTRAPEGKPGGPFGYRRLCRQALKCEALRGEASPAAWNPYVSGLGTKGALLFSGHRPGCGVPAAGCRPRCAWGPRLWMQVPFPHRAARFSSFVANVLC